MRPRHPAPPAKIPARRPRLATALVLAALGAACDDGRYLVGVLGQGQTAAGGGMAVPMGAGGAGGYPMGAGGAPAPVPAPLCREPARPLPMRPVLISSSQLAERLARLMFSDRPDAALFAKTAMVSNSVQAQDLARELFRDSRAVRGIGAVVGRWLRLSQVREAPGATVVRDQVTPQLRQSMLRETQLFTEELFLRGDGLLRTFLTASFTFADQTLAEIYGAGGPAPGMFTRINLDPNQRSGVLTHAGLLFAHPRATSRGFWLRDALVCQVIPPPPDSLMQPDIDRPVSINKTSRQRLEEATSQQPACTACHDFMDPPGFAFEHYDPLGHWRETENGEPVNSGGYLISMPSGAAFMFGGALSLGQQLASTCDVQICAVQTFLQVALGSSGLPGNNDRSVRELWGAFLASNFDLRELFIAVAGSEAFLSP